MGWKNNISNLFHTGFYHVMKIFEVFENKNYCKFSGFQARPTRCPQQYQKAFVDC